MSGWTAAAVALAALAGLAGSVQAAVMGRLGERIGSFEAVAFALALSTALAVALLLATSRSLAGFAEALRQPAWLWTGGIWGLLVVITITVVTPRIGTTATIGILIAGQLIAGTVIDRFGLFGFEQIAISWPRALGVALLALGAGLSLHR